MKILHLFDHSLPIQDGYAYRSLNILTEQRARGWDTVHITSSKHGDVEAGSETFDGLEFHRTNGSGSRLWQLPILEQWDVVATLEARTKTVIEALAPDLVHAHSPPLVGLAACRAAAHSGLPVVYEVRAFWEDAAVDTGACREGDLRYRATRALESYVIRRADAVTCICQGLYDDIRARGVNADKLTVIPNAINPAQFAGERHYDERLAAELHLTRGETVGFVGSFYAYEGLDLLISALPRMLQARAGLKLLLVGGGNEDQRLRAQVAALGLEASVVFTGRVAHQDVSRYYDLIDVLAYPRAPMRLTELVTPLKPLEAMVQDRLVVASDVGGHRELIDHERTGLLFRAGDEAALAAAILRLLGDPDQQQRLRRAGHAFVTTERTWQRSVSHYEQAYAHARAARRA